jgi:hypothetical protein
VYIFGKQDWQSWQTIQQIRANEQWASKQTSQSKTTQARPLTQREPIPLVYFFGVFLLCAGFLWLEPKL